MEKIIFLLGEKIECAAGDDGVERGNRGERYICSVREPEKMEGLIVGTVLIEKPVIGEKTGIIDFLFQNGSNIGTVES